MRLFVFPYIFMLRPIETQVPRVVWTTENSRRISSWQQLNRPYQTTSIAPPDPEPHIRETQEIAAAKIQSVADTEPLQALDQILSADALTFAGKNAMRKPKNKNELRDNFRAIKRNHGQYDIRSHTVRASFDKNGELSLSSYPIGTRIQITPEWSRKLATLHGRRIYLKKLHDLYDGKVSFKKIASGICVAVLIALGAVETLDGQKLEDLDAHTAQELIYSTLFTAIINVSPQAILAVADILGPQDDPKHVDDWEKLSQIDSVVTLTSHVWYAYTNHTLR